MGNNPLTEDQQRSAVASKSTWISAAVNLSLSLLQILVGLVARSQGLVADGIHSLSDLVADFVVLLATRESRKEADQEHPYGHQRFETAASLALGLLLLGVGVVMMSTALHRLIDPANIPRVSLPALWVALVALVAKESLFRYMLSIAKKVKSSMLVANAWHARSDALSSLVVGCGIVGNLLGYRVLDPVAALIVAVMIGHMGWKFAWDALQDLMDRAADDDEVKAIRDTIANTPGVRGVHDLRTRKMGDMIVVDAHIEVDANITVEAGHDIAVAARERVFEHHRVLDLLTHIDPWHRPDRDHTQHPHLTGSTALD